MNSKISFCLLRLQEWVIFLFVLPLLFAGSARAGSYLNSAHGSSTYGVLRLTGYARGNCAHCHEQHASVGGTTITPSPYTLFASNFDTTKKTGSYSEGNDFCFSCHSNSSSAVQQVTNYDYSKVFGGAGALVGNIMAAFNQLSYHNLNDILTFAEPNFSWFTSDSNPCNACHNPHLARRNYLAPQQTTVAGALSLSAISKPSKHFALWGTTTAQTMANAYPGQYEPPYSSDTNPLKFEPAGLPDATTSGQRTPDYVAFCIDCHNTNSSNTIPSTTLGRDLIKIDWGAGDQHGAVTGTGTGTRALKAPYSSTTNYVLSCLDCHEPHGSPNITLLRRRVNGGDLVDNITTALPDYSKSSTTFTNHGYGYTQLSYLCIRCHNDDSVYGGTVNKWQNVHHLLNGSPYPNPKRCVDCHNGSPWSNPIECDICHFHGGTDAWLGGTKKTF